MMLGNVQAMEIGRFRFDGKFQTLVELGGKRPVGRMLDMIEKTDLHSPCAPIVIVARCSGLSQFFHHQLA